MHVLVILGMTCGACSGRLKRLLEANDNVMTADISHETNYGTITTTGFLSSEHLIDLINSAGFIASA